VDKTIHFFKHGESILNTGGITMEIKKFRYQQKVLNNPKPLTGTQRRRIADSFWTAGYANKLIGVEADTFIEFSERENRFIAEMFQQSKNIVLFGHGIWFGMLFWKLMGFPADKRQAMIGFRRSQNGLPI
jgi:broad specificity phosphatase PhoE